MEAYVFASTIYWFACFGISRWSSQPEKRLQAAHGG